MTFFSLIDKVAILAGGSQGTGCRLRSPFAENGADIAIAAPRSGQARVAEPEEIAAIAPLNLHEQLGKLRNRAKFVIEGGKLVLAPRGQNWRSELSS